MPLSLYCSQAREKKAFKPLNDNHVTLYACGPTVYSDPHIGNARPCVVFDTLYRVLSAQYTKVTYARNITDVDDKINKAAMTQGVSIESISEKYTKAYHRDARALGCLSPTVEPRATQHIPEMIALTQALIDRGHAYESDKHVMFSVNSYSDYGALSRRQSESRQPGARVSVADYKKHADDFVLWKPSTPEEPGWDSPWGRGRPGWHLECSAMIEKHLGLPFDIHGGGGDLLFPHHENEMAQGCCAFDIPYYAGIWMHNGMIQIKDEKMSKSIGNILTVKKLLQASPGEAIRLKLLQTHYRQPLQWQTSLLDQAKVSLDKYYRALKHLESVDHQVNMGFHNLWSTLPQAIQDAFNDDLNTPKAIMIWQQMIKDAMNVDVQKDEAKTIKQALLATSQVLGVGQLTTDGWFQQNQQQEFDASWIDSMIQERQLARANKDFKRADEIRQLLDKHGIILEDGNKQTGWRKK